MGFFSSTFPSGPAALGLFLKSTHWECSSHVCVPLQSVPGDGPDFLSHESRLVRPLRPGPRKMALGGWHPLVQFNYERSCQVGLWLWKAASEAGPVPRRAARQQPGWRRDGGNMAFAMGTEGSSHWPQAPRASTHPSSPHERKQRRKREQSASTPRRCHGGSQPGPGSLLWRMAGAEAKGAARAPEKKPAHSRTWRRYWYGHWRTQTPLTPRVWCLHPPHHFPAPFRAPGPTQCRQGSPAGTELLIVGNC